mgnify:FL=1
MCMNPLQNYLEANGILLCNRNSDLPALEDVGCTWQDVTELIDQRRLFYSKVFRKRTTYLSPEAYYLLKAAKSQKPLTPPAERILSLLGNGSIAETAFLKRVCGLSPKEYRDGFDFLLQNLYITAMANGTVLNESWSTFQYGTAQTWEALSPPPPQRGDPKARLWELLRPTVPERCFRSLIR